MIIGIHHIAIGVPDFEAGLRFYRDTLGFDEVQRSTFDSASVSPKVEAAIGIDKPTMQMAMLRGGNAYIELWQYSEPTPRDRTANPPDLGYPHFALEVQNIEAECARLRGAGMSFVGDPVNFGDTSAIYGRDPFGNVIELYEIRSENRASINNTQLLQPDPEL